MLPKRFVPMHCVGRHTIPKQNGSTPVTFWRPVNVRCRVQQDAMQMDVNQCVEHESEKPKFYKKHPRKKSVCFPYRIITN